MKAMSVIPGQAGSAQVAEVPDPPDSDGSILVQGRLVGICGHRVPLSSWLDALTRQPDDVKAAVDLRD